MSQHTISLDKNSFVISLNAKRLEMMQRIFEHYKIPMPILFNGAISRDGTKGCLLSHWAIYKIAETLNLPYTIIFEDDAFPRKNIIEYFNNAIECVPEDWNFLKIEDLFYNKYVDIENVNDYWMKARSNSFGSGSAAYIVRDSAYTLLSRMIEKSEFDSRRFPIDFMFMQTQMSQLGGYYISRKPMFLQHNIHHSGGIHEHRMFKESDIIFPPEDDKENFEPHLFTS